MRREHLLTAVLADDTRFAIYRFIAERPRSQVTVAEVADRFKLHPNVARMHLSKLEQAGLVRTALRKHQRGGRPAKLYGLADRVATFAVPPRHYELLAALALEVLAESNDSELIRRVCRRAGHELATAYRTDRGMNEALDGHALAAAVQDIAEDQGLLPEVSWRPAGLRIEVRNCVFREAGAAQPELSCTIHRWFLRGVLDELAGADEGADLVADPQSICSGADGCCFTYTVRGHERPQA